MIKSVFFVRNSKGFPLKPGGLPELAPEVEFLDHLANMVVAINMSGKIFNFAH